MNEALGKVLCHNIRVVSQSMDELGVEPVFWQVAGGDRHELDTLRSALGEAAFAAAWERGRALPLEQTIECALEEAQDERSG